MRTQGSVGVPGGQASSQLTIFNRFSDFLASARMTSNRPTQFVAADEAPELLAVHE
jgi:hypothetical protein